MDKLAMKKLANLQLRPFACWLGVLGGEKGRETEKTREMGEQLFVTVRTSPRKCSAVAFGRCALCYNSNL